MAKFSPRKIEQGLATISDFFQEHHLNYLLIGALALSVWGRPRTTLDLDFLILMDEKGMSLLAGWARKEGLRIDRKWLLWNPLLKGTQLRLWLGSIAVDLMRPRDAHDVACFRRKRRKRLGNRLWNLISPEDFVLQKLKVGRPRDFEDAVTVLEHLRGKLALSYIRRWAKRLGILEEFNYIFTL